MTPERSISSQRERLAKLADIGWWSNMTIGFIVMTKGFMIPTWMNFFENGMNPELFVKELGSLDQTPAYVAIAAVLAANELGAIEGRLRGRTRITGSVIGPCLYRLIKP